MTTKLPLMKQLPRRRFLKFGSVAFATVCFLPAFSANQPRDFGKLSMGVHGASFRQFSVADTLRIIVEELGINEIELTAAQIRLHGAPQSELATVGEVRALRAALDSAGVKATAYGFVPMAIDPGTNHRLFEMAQELGLENLTVIPEDGSLDHLEELADRYNIRLAIHNNAPGGLFDSMQQVYDAVAGRGSNVGACVDIGNVLRSNEDPALAIRTLGPRVFGIHLKDVSDRSNDSDVVGLGEGVLDTEALFRALSQTDLPGNMACSLEYLANPADPVPNMLQSLALSERLLSP